MNGSCNITKSRNKREGKYKAKRFGKHFRSLRILIDYITSNIGNSLYSGPAKVIK